MKAILKAIAQKALQAATLTAYHTSIEGGVAIRVNHLVDDTFVIEAEKDGVIKVSNPVKTRHHYTSVRKAMEHGEFDQEVARLAGDIYAGAKRTSVFFDKLPEPKVEEVKIVDIDFVDMYKAQLANDRLIDELVERVTDVPAK